RSSDLADVPHRCVFQVRGISRCGAGALQDRRRGRALPRPAALLAVGLHHLPRELSDEMDFACLCACGSKCGGTKLADEAGAHHRDFFAGGSSDIVARLISAPLQNELGQSIIVDNKPGAGGTIGALEAARAAPDGYTLLLSNSSPISISPAMQDEPRYDPVKSFTHVSYVGSVANVFVVHPGVPAKNLAELIAWIKAQPNAVNYGSGGIGSIG